jgi:hypothetical protein
VVSRLPIQGLIEAYERREADSLQKLVGGGGHVDQAEVRASNAKLRVKPNEHGDPRLIHIANLLEG